MSNNTKAASGGIGCLFLFEILLTVLFIGLKLTGYITWSWVWVLSPIWIGVGLGVLLIILVLLIIAFLAIFK